MTKAQRGALLAAVLGSGIVFLDSTVVTVALPRIGQELPARAIGVLEGQAYVYNAYLLALSALLILAGALTDQLGRRRVFSWGLLAFGLTSLLCGIAPTLELLVAFRVLQGAAGAFLVPGSLALITAAFTGESQGRAFGIWAGASALTTIFGPVVGGLLVDAISWRAAFLINLPLVAVTWWITLSWVAESREEVRRRFDWLGAVVGALAVGGLTFGLIRGQERAWADGASWMVLAVGIAAAVGFPLLMRRENALVPPSLFGYRNYTVTNISTFVIYGALYTSLYFLTLFLQGVLGYTATAAGVATVPAILLLAFFSERFGAFAARYGPRRFMVAGPVLMAAGDAWLARLPAASAPWRLGSSGASLFPPADYWTDVFPGLIVFGAGAMVMVAPLTTALMSSIPVENAGVASAVNNAISRIGPQIAGALIFVAVTSVFLGTLEGSVGPVEGFAPLNPAPAGASVEEDAAARSASADAFHVAMLINTALLLLGAGVNAGGIRDSDVVKRTDITPVSIAGQECVPLPCPPEPLTA
jgi:EmrB/QacA subfamily drug resistance transporter